MWKALNKHELFVYNKQVSLHSPYVIFQVHTLGKTIRNSTSKYFCSLPSWRSKTLVMHLKGPFWNLLLSPFPPVLLQPWTSCLFFCAWCASLYACVFYCSVSCSTILYKWYLCKKENLTGLRQLFLERPIGKAGPWLVSRNLDFRRVPNSL